MHYDMFSRLPNGQPGYSAPIDASNNWWGSASTGYVNGKIWDGLDNDTLVPVEYMPIKINNVSFIYGKVSILFIESIVLLAQAPRL